MRSRTIPLAFFLLFTYAVLAQNSTPKQIVASFYKFDLSHSQQVNYRSVNARKRWFSDSLYGLFLVELGLQNEHLKQHPTDKPFFGDGFPFHPYDEPCDTGGRRYNWAYHVGRVSVRGNTATVDVSFFYPKICGLEPTIYKLELSRTKGNWQIEDVIYPGGSSLVSDMKAHRY